MIEKMKMVHVVSTLSRKDELLEGLQNLGLLHLSEKKAADRKAAERFATLSGTVTALSEYEKARKRENARNSRTRNRGTRQSGGKGSNRDGAAEVLSDEAFEILFRDVQSCMERKAALSRQKSAASAEIDRVRSWGGFSPADVESLRQAGCDLHFYRVLKSEFKALARDESIRFLRLKPVDGMEAVAVVGKLPPETGANEFILPEKSLDELTGEVASCERGIAACEAELREKSAYLQSFRAQMLKAQNEENYSSASETADSDQDFVWISGYIPEDDLETFKTAAGKNNWAWAADDVSEEDDQVPTKVKYNRVSALIKPVFDILGILPGYREQDISLFFFLFFTLFFAMIIGDAGYGFLILIAGIVLSKKLKIKGNTIFLIYVLSVATIVWGAMTGTWFGLEEAMHVPFLKALVIPQFANYPQYFNLTATAQQNNIMKFSFTIGAIQMTLGSILAIRKKIAEKNLSWISDVGWIIAVLSMYLLSLYLVIGENIPIIPVFGGIGIAFVLVVLFGGMSPEKTFAQGLKAGVSGAFTAFLNTISCFGNVMSYIRLFAVGMAGLAIAQSFNGIAAGFHGAMMILGIVVVIIGHALNLIMCFLSVVVHGVRLNVLEFSGQAGLEWTGIAYHPFQKNRKLEK